MKTNLVCDIPNLFWRSVAAMRKSNNPEDDAGLALHMCLMSLRKHYNAVRPDNLIVTFEGYDNWRKEYTKSEECYSKKLYKGNRVKDPSMAVLFDVLKAFQELIVENTSIISLTHPKLEADDLNAGYAQFASNNNESSVILSGDKDYVYLLRDKNIKLLNPDNSVYRTVESVCGIDDAEYFMFEKCFKGDPGDNVLPARPRVRKTKLQAAFGINGNAPDTFLLSNLMAEHWDYKDGDGNTRSMHVEKLFKENNLLMNLYEQPEHIRMLIDDTIKNGLEARGKFNFFKFNKFLGKFHLQQIADKSTDFVQMFSSSINREVEKPVLRVGGMSID